MGLGCAWTSTPGTGAGDRALFKTRVPEIFDIQAVLCFVHQGCWRLQQNVRALQRHAGIPAGHLFVRRSLYINAKVFGPKRSSSNDIVGSRLSSNRGLALPGRLRGRAYPSLWANWA